MICGGCSLTTETMEIGQTRSQDFECVLFHFVTHHLCGQMVRFKITCAILLNSDVCNGVEQYIFCVTRLFAVEGSRYGAKATRIWLTDSLFPFYGHFLGEPGLAVVYWSKGWWRWWVVTTGAISRAKLQSNHHHQQTNIQFFYSRDVLPVAQPTVSKHWREWLTVRELIYTVIYRAQSYSFSALTPLIGCKKSYTGNIKRWLFKRPVQDLS